MLTIDISVNIGYTYSMAKELLSTGEAARILGISRIAVFKKIKSGTIKAQKAGRNFIIEKKELGDVLGSVLRGDRKREIEKAVKKVVEEYGTALKLLGKE